MSQPFLEQKGKPLPETADSASLLSSQLRAELWSRVAERLQQGEVLLSNQHFEAVAVEEFHRLTGQEPPLAVLRQIQHMIEVVNREHPETYLASGLQNGIRQAFEKGIHKLKWDVAKIQAKGASSLRRFKKMEFISELFEDANIRPDQIDILGCLVETLKELDSGKPAAPPPAAKSSPAIQFSDSIIQDQKETHGQDKKELELLEAVQTGEVKQEELEQRQHQQEKSRKKIEDRENEKLHRYLPAIVERGVISADEADKVKALRDVDERVAKGEIDEKEANRVRNSILDKKTRDEVERKVKEVVEQSVRYLQVFEAMQKISPEYDDALWFLIDNKELVVAEAHSSVDPTAVLKGLLEDGPLLDRIIGIMERKDQELRMLSIRLPPYNGVMSRGLEKIGNMTIEPEFVDDLRKLSVDDMSERLNSGDREVRVRPAADIRCLVSLVDHVHKPTRFRKEIRLLRLTQSLEEFFSSTKDLRSARSQAENFLNRRLRRLFPDLSAGETSEIKQRGAEMIDEIEHRVLEERQAAVEEKRKKIEESVEKKAEPAQRGEDDLELTEEERQKGVQIGRVEMRVAGSQRRIPNKIMLDPDDASIFVIGQRDPDSGELIPQMRRGAKRQVERGKDGIWRLVHN